MNQEQIEQYVAGRMGEAEALAFEEYCLANPEFARQVEYEQRLKAGIGAGCQRLHCGIRALRASAALEPGCRCRLADCVRRGDVPSGPPDCMRRPPAIMAAVTASAPQGDASLRLALVRGSDTAPALPPGLVRVEIVGLFDAGNFYSVALDRREQNQEIDTVATLNDQRPSFAHEPRSDDRQQTASSGVLFPAGPQTGLGRRSPGFRLRQSSDSRCHGCDVAEILRIAEAINS